MMKATGFSVEKGTRGGRRRRGRQLHMRHLTAPGGCLVGLMLVVAAATTDQQQGQGQQTWCKQRVMNLQHLCRHLQTLKGGRLQQLRRQANVHQRAISSLSCGQTG